MSFALDAPHYPARYQPPVGLPPAPARPGYSALQRPLQASQQLQQAPPQPPVRQQQPRRFVCTMHAEMRELVLQQIQQLRGLTVPRAATAPPGS